MEVVLEAKGCYDPDFDVLQWWERACNDVGVVNHFEERLLDQAQA